MYPSQAGHLLYSIDSNMLKYPDQRRNPYHQYIHDLYF